MKEVTKQEVEANFKIHNWLKANRFADLSSVRAICYDVSFPFTEEELNNYKQSREDNFEKVQRTENGWSW